MVFGRWPDAMPRFYFDVRDGEYVQKDDQGVELYGIQDAKDHALRALPDIARDEMPDRNRREFVIEVKDENGRAVLTARLSLTVDIVV